MAVELRKKVVWGGRVRLVCVLVASALMSPSCATVRQGTGSSYLILTSLAGGGSSGTVESDVVADDGTIKADSGTATFQLAMKDTLLTPSPNNSITVDRYHVQYVRSDGLNTQGVDVPFAFDGAVTVTVAGTSTVGFTLVRLAAKQEAPLKTLSAGGSPITTIAQVTFFGHDQTGHDVSVSGNIEVTFANFAG